MVKKQIEVEFRAQLGKSDYDRVQKVLEDDGEKIGEKNQASYYFYDSGKSFKMVHDKDKAKVRIAHKAKTIREGTDFEEYEIIIEPEHIKVALPLFKSLLEINRVIYDEQKRHDYKYKGLEIALKWSEGWGYHIEFEKVVTKQVDVTGAEAQIKKVAKELGIELMTIDDIKKLEKDILAKLERGDYKIAGYV